MIGRAWKSSAIFAAGDAVRTSAPSASIKSCSPTVRPPAAPRRSNACALSSRGSVRQGTLEAYLRGLGNSDRALFCELQELLTLFRAYRPEQIAAALERLAHLELQARQGRAIERRFRLSRLPAQPTLDQIHFAHHKSRQQARNRILHLLDLDFLKQGTSVVIIGNRGVGKTFLAQILGWRACQANGRGLFTTAMEMLDQLLASQVDHSLVRKLNVETEPAVSLNRGLFSGAALCDSPALEESGG